MHRFFLALHLTLAICHSIAAEETSPTAEIKRLVAILAEATRKGDGATLVNYMPDTIVEALGGKAKASATIERMIKEMIDQGVVITSITVGEPGELLVEGTNTFVLVPMIMEFDTPESWGNARSFLLGISPDGGKTWKFVDAARLDNPLTKKVLPTFPTALKLPKKSTPEFHFGRRPKGNVANGIEGSWTLVTHVFSGETLKSAGSLQLTKDQAVFSFAGQEPYHAAIRFDGAKSPAEIDLTFTDGPAKGLNRKGILLQDVDSLVLCFHAALRPSKFDSPVGSEIILYELKRSR